MFARRERSAMDSFREVVIVPELRSNLSIASGDGGRGSNWLSFVLGDSSVVDDAIGDMSVV